MATKTASAQHRVEPRLKDRLDRFRSEEIVDAPVTTSARDLQPRGSKNLTAGTVRSTPHLLPEAPNCKGRVTRCRQEGMR